MAASRRGWVMPIFPFLQKPAQKIGRSLIKKKKVERGSDNDNKYISDESAEPTCFMEKLRKLGGFSATSLTGDKQKSAFFNSVY